MSKVTFLEDPKFSLTSSTGFDKAYGDPKKIAEDDFTI